VGIVVVAVVRDHHVVVGGYKVSTSSEEVLVRNVVGSSVRMVAFLWLLK